LGRKGGRRLCRLLDEVAREHREIQDPEQEIRRGAIVVDGRVITNPASLVRAGASIVVRSEPVLRGEAKLRAALETFEVVIEGRIALDVGAAAGGFTRVLLEAGASTVYAVDVGYGQLLGSLRQDARVVNLEATNIAELDRASVPDVIGVVTIDLSYLALSVAAPQLARVRLARDAEAVALVKPQFEPALAEPPVDPERLAQAVAKARSGLEMSAWTVEGAIESPVRGARGAIEYLLHARRKAEGLYPRSDGDDAE
jgi:23S rRNA (cytidine1920-2'-O)/16S rRNA (cytidine1409-2'-O)-methyltransferase